MSDILTTKEQFVEAITRLAESVYEFHERFGVGGIDFSADDTFDTLRRRLSILVEEHARALNKGDLDQAGGEAADVAFVALGTLLWFEAKGCFAALAVARKNDQKTPEDYEEGASGKVAER